MTKANLTLILSLLICTVASSNVEAQQAIPKTVACSSRVKLQDAINTIPAGQVGTISVSGTCNENLVIPRGKTIEIIGNPTAVITPLVNSKPAVMSLGDTLLQKLSITNTSGTADTLVGTSQSTVRIVASTLQAPKVQAVVGVYENSSAWISNSRITGGTSWGAIEVWGSSMLSLVGNPGDVSGPDGFLTTVQSASGPSIGCSDGGSMWISARTANNRNGSIKISGGDGLNANACQATLNNKTNSVRNLWVTQSYSYSGISAWGSTLVLNKVEVSGNSDIGLSADSTSVKISGSKFSNKNGDIDALNKSNVIFTNWQGPSSFPKALNDEYGSFSCHGLGSDSQILANGGSISGDVEAMYEKYAGCLN